MSGGRPLTASEEWIFAQWTDRLRQAIGAMTGEAPKACSGNEPAAGPMDQDILWWEQTFSAAADAKLCVGAPAQTWRSIGDEILKSAGIDNGDDENIRSTYQEILSQSLSGVAQSISARLRREVMCAAGAEPKTAPSVQLSVQLTLGNGPVALFLSVSEALAQLCETSTAAPPAPPPKETLVGDRNTTTGDERAYPKGLDLLLDVELPVSVSFGRAELPIKDVIKLTTGSIVELNRSISEPVEIIVNNVVIARGEVVVVEGNFGVRIKQVISRQERLRTLR